MKDSYQQLFGADSRVVAVLQQHAPLHGTGREAFLQLVVEDSFDLSYFRSFHGASCPRHWLNVSRSAPVPAPKAAWVPARSGDASRKKILMIVVDDHLSNRYAETVTWKSIDFRLSWHGTLPLRRAPFHGLAAWHRFRTVLDRGCAESAGSRRNRHRAVRG
jgi:hypothetical protein